MNYNLDNAISYHYEKFPPLNINYGFFIQEFSKATEALARFDQMMKNLHNTEILLAPLRNQEAVISSRIEGTISTMDEIMQYESENIENTNVKSDIIEAILYQRALKNSQEALEIGYDFSKNFIKQIHQQLLYLGRGANKSPGEFKKTQNFLANRITKSIEFIPISPEKLEDGLDIFFHFLNNSIEPSLIKTAIMHLEFEALHPFEDGNGRIGRMLIPLNLWRDKMLSQPHFYISGYFETHKDLYIEQMRYVSKTGDWNNWIKFFLTAVEKQAIQNLEIAENIKNLYENTKVGLSDLLSSKWTMEIVDFIFTSPIFRGNKPNIPSSSLGEILKKMIDHNYLTIKEKASGRKPALYSFEPLMNLVRI